MLDRGFMGLGLSHCLSSQLLLEEYCLYVCINCAKLIHFWQLFSFKKSKLELFELLLDGRRHHDHGFVRVLRPDLVRESDLFVPWALDGDADLQIAGDLVEFFALGVRECKPLVGDGVLVLEVDKGQVEFIGSN